MAVVDILKGSRLWLLDAVCSDSQYLFFMAKKRKKKQPFGGAGGSASVSSAAVGRAAFDADRQGGVFNFFRDFGVRETIESVIVAIILAMLFRGFEAEAFIIPTGSMAPSLQGQHMDLANIVIEPAQVARVRRSTTRHRSRVRSAQFASLKRRCVLGKLQIIAPTTEIGFWSTSLSTMLSRRSGMT